MYNLKEKVYSRLANWIILALELIKVSIGNMKEMIFQLN